MPETDFGFTGTRLGLSAAQHLWLPSVIPAGVTVHHGACVGADAQFHECARRAGNPVIAHPPINPRLRMPYDTYATWLPAKDYLDRDRDIVDASAHLLATPDGPERQQSGTWYTVRYAVKCGTPVTICFPDGTLERR